MELDKDILEEIETIFTISFDNNHDAEIIYNSISPELSFTRNDRSKTNIEINDNNLTITIHSTDIASLRASINSYVRWINLSIKILKI